MVRGQVDRHRAPHSRLLPRRLRRRLASATLQGRRQQLRRLRRLRPLRSRQALVPDRLRHRSLLPCRRLGTPSGQRPHLHRRHSQPLLHAPDQRVIPVSRRLSRLLDGASDPAGQQATHRQLGRFPRRHLRRLLPIRESQRRTLRPLQRRPRRPHRHRPGIQPPVHPPARRQRQPVQHPPRFDLQQARRRQRPLLSRPIALAPGRQQPRHLPQPRREQFLVPPLQHHHAPRGRRRHRQHHRPPHAMDTVAHGRAPRRRLPL